MSVETEEKKCVNAELVARLRQLADVLEQENIPDLRGWVSLDPNGCVGICDSGFRRLFAGAAVNGRKDGDAITWATAEAYGLMFSAALYTGPERRQEIIQL